MPHGVTHRQCLYINKTNQIALKLRTFTALGVSVAHRIVTIQRVQFSTLC